MSETSAFSGETKIGPLPAWAWAVGAGGLLGLVWFLRKPAKTTGTDASSPTTQPVYTGSPTTTVMPVDQGLSDNQFKLLWDQLLKLQGQPSTPPPSSGPPPGTTPPPFPTPPPVTIPSPVPTPPPSQPAPVQDLGTQWYSVKSGDSFSSIASRYGKSWQELWNYQLQPGIRPAETQATLKSRGPDNALFSGSSVAIPGTWRLT